ncbi:MAG: hypothetical protein U9N39_10620 [Campylobacterota bacterium]|nr:hypothetical protein [Campylobacterota bacterium]
MIQKLLLIVVFASTLFSSELKEGERLKLFVLPDQFEVYHTVDRHVKTIIVSFEKDTSADINAYLSSKSPEFLKSKDAVFIANISKMPAIITKMFAMPKLKKLKHSILLINDEADKRFSSKEEKFTIYKLENSIVKELLYVNSIKELEKAF